MKYIHAISVQIFVNCFGTTALYFYLGLAKWILQLELILYYLVNFTKVLLKITKWVQFFQISWWFCLAAIQIVYFRSVYLQRCIILWLKEIYDWRNSDSLLFAQDTFQLIAMFTCKCTQPFKSRSARWNRLSSISILFSEPRAVGSSENPGVPVVVRWA